MLRISSYGIICQLTVSLKESPDQKLKSIIMTSVPKSGKRLQPLWNPPLTGGENRGLKVYNSLTRKKEEFVPQQGRKVTWYSCGPTVYDSAHMGHARAYITIDILRRVMQSYFGYQVYYVMNITDIDDKIIKRARQRYLIEEYRVSAPSAGTLATDLKTAVELYTRKTDGVTDSDKKDMRRKTTHVIQEVITKLDQGHTVQVSDVIDRAWDVLSDWLDDIRGAEVTDQAVFEELPRHYEAEFHEDMLALNILPPDVLTRVSEYVPEVVSFVQTILDNGFAYVSNGSVYFDTRKFSQTQGHFYAKLVPEAYGDEEALKEGEGDLSISTDQLQEKRHATDFVLWKKSKTGEPHWESPWGGGRPGWHIECSVMASSLLGDSMDIHTGGVDLKFPHHDNEMAQSEAVYGNSHWVRYFMHAGHLKIEGAKMAKSLKNFITIREVLQRYTARQLRLLFVLHSWKDTLDYSADTMAVALAYEKNLHEFFMKVKDITRKAGTGPNQFKKWAEQEVQLNEQFYKSQECVHQALCDNVDTRRVMEEFRQLISTTNVYISDKRKMEGEPNAVLVKNIASYISHILKVLGVIEDSTEPLGFKSTSEVVSKEEVVMPYLEAFAKFRNDVRQVGRSEKCASVLELCDNLRDVVLPSLGVQFEDQGKGESIIKMVDHSIHNGN